MTPTYLVDTSVAIPLISSSHSAHESVNRVVGRRKVGLAGHAAFETYSVLTRLPGDARLNARDALDLMADRFVTSETGPHVVFPETVSQLASVGIVGGAVYDGLVALWASAVRGSILLSRDLRAAATYGRLGALVELISSDD